MIYIFDSQKDTVPQLLTAINGSIWVLQNARNIFKRALDKDKSKAVNCYYTKKNVRVIGHINIVRYALYWNFNSRVRMGH